MSDLKALDNLRKTLKSCVMKAGVEPNEFDTYWITASACDACIDEVEREISERFMLLPVDADGVPIRVGDVIAEKPFRPNIGEKPAEVVCMLLNSDGWAIGDCDPRGHWYGPLQREHVKPDPLEELLNEHLQEREKIVRKLESSMITLGEAESEEDACDKLFAERIRELMGGTE